MHFPHACSQLQTILKAAGLRAVPCVSTWLRTHTRQARSECLTAEWAAREAERWVKRLTKRSTL